MGTTTQWQFDQTSEIPSAFSPWALAWDYSCLEKQPGEQGGGWGWFVPGLKKKYFGIFPSWLIHFIKIK